VKITAPLLRTWGACWTDEKIKTALAGRESVTPAEVAAAEYVSLDDRLWVLCRCLWHLDKKAERFFAIESASLVSHLAGDEDDQGIYLGLLNDLAQIENEVTPEGRDAARAAARDAARDAAWAAELRKAIARALEWLGEEATS